jgi:hypothetical protein
MIISDLEFWFPIEYVNNIIGGASTRANAQTVASSGFSYAQSDANAVGDQTYTSTTTNTSIFNTAIANVSYSYANGNAYALDRNNSSSTSSYTSISFWASTQ